MLNVPMHCIELILEQAGIIAITDKYARYTFVNKMWQHDTGISEKEALGKYAHEIIEGSRAIAAITSGKVLTADMFIKKKDGTSLPGVMTYYPIFSGNEVIGCFIYSSFESMEQAFAFSEKLESITAEYEFLKGEMRKRSGVKYSVDDIIGKSDAVKLLKEHIYQAGASNSTVLIEGETGTGKELVAHSIHACSLRNIFPFVKVNCSAIPASLMESEFFGYEEGTFTGAKKGGQKGKFEIAHLGSIFLDEINQMDMTMQPKLLRVLQEKEIERIGSSDSIPIDTRVITASNASLREMIRRNQFRSDLYYRLNIINIVIPPLRSRREDIPLLVDNMIEKISNKVGREIDGISNKAIEYLKYRDWPGNIRELQNAIEKAMNVSRKSNLSLEDFKKFESYESFNPEKLVGMEDISMTNENDSTLMNKKNTIEKSTILDVLEMCEYNKSKAAKKLGISRTLLYQKLRKYNIEIEEVM
ncbi:sigma-54 interaction domain-containing protein [Sedimentibacter saalensis]|uniref:sigma-54 interaction domain-containing protein n=1 Tax=Sedimentibacter saalensis TaxID=130788 RepID=UPI0028988313|nr:sigma 54-interacting transcriptional regulator [Sedimentibacter saalensis]